MIDSMHQSWLPRVVAAAFPGEGAKDPFALLQRRQPQVVTAASTCCPQMPLQKLLFSATLTQNPEKLQQLGLHQPWLFSTRPARGGPRDTDEDADSGGKYTFPAGLSHHYVPCRLRAKPLVVLHLILHLGFSRILCFTNSRENSHRLFLLVQAFGGVTVAEFSSRYGPGQRKGILKQFEQGKIQLLISTDATARGIDVQGVQLVVNYDAPQYLRTYVHRVGRTARAGTPDRPSRCSSSAGEEVPPMLTEAGVPELERTTPPASSCSRWSRSTRRPCPSWRGPSRKNGGRRQPRPGSEDNGTEPGRTGLLEEPQRTACSAHARARPFVTAPGLARGGQAHTGPPLISRSSGAGADGSDGPRTDRWPLSCG
ncbi:ATP-dependent RNA helicase DDX51 [Myotis lucifugus]|uniref:ATP-dependent RNA helicase DDX51 n=1 Tax=Myotis lucifugus TaxID=59463 RepID=UPI0006D73F39|nr:ATP-dependent RNA helicase DDX51 [Myotis lucifugus]